MDIVRFGISEEIKAHRGFCSRIWFVNSGHFYRLYFVS